ncbi:DUF4278 domain-containing protein [Nostoc sphaeroides CHAB 2801]|uniref:DUF4278 domain-containing protein n=1 Tax=Nostoc sphaeroides TaxID=446679 RepID=UPI001E4D1153|nr:DUF4278 domain-containing protein [Nostoc sphaeroides]MCC5632534.1 DUF4278 domain-containing protein [Nostoc sphaeroides CHAB 2801]
MKLYYRGLTYEYASSEVAKKVTKPFEPVCHQGCAYNLTYRGLTYRVDPNIEREQVQAPTVAYQLMYRGIVYCVQRTHTGEVSTTFSQPANCVPAMKLKWGFLYKPSKRGIMSFLKGKSWNFQGNDRHRLGKIEVLKTSRK